MTLSDVSVMKKNYHVKCTNSILFQKFVKFSLLKVLLYSSAQYNLSGEESGAFHDQKTLKCILKPLMHAFSSWEGLVESKYL